MEVIVRCQVHNTKLNRYENCDVCESSFNAQMEKFAGGVVNISGMPHQSPKKYFVNKKEVLLHHETDWLEWELPEIVAKRAEAFIEQELSKFLSQCDCLICMEARE